MSKLGVYWSVMHRRQTDYDYFKRLQPSVFKIMDGGAPDYQFARDHLPDSLVLARIHSLSEQHDDMLKNPVATGTRHAEEWAVHQQRLGFDKAKTLVLGINEPRVWEPGVPEALRYYTIALCDRATELGLRVGAMQLSVGWPANTGADTPPNWEPWAGVDNAIRANNGALVLHEYFANNGPGEMWGWWAGRSLKCPWDVPIVIGECGIDMYVKDGSVPHNARGWRAHVDAGRYANELADYVSRMSADKRFVGCCVFASDFANREWASFDVEPAYNAILSTPIPAPPTQTHIPAVSKPQPAPTGDTWQRSRAFVRKWEGDYQNVENDSGNWTGGAVGVGELKGTKYGISAASYPHLDIKNLTIEQADEIYFRDYWQASGADKLPWPACLIVFDTAVLHGVGTARKWVDEVGDNAFLFAAKRLRVYTRMDNWHYWGAGWTNRVADLLEVAAQ